jgi:sugar lactone lactonase YvrE
VVSLAPKSCKPAPVAAHLLKHYPNGKFLPGTLVASCQGSLPEYGDHTPPDVPSPLGLNVVLDEDGKPRHSVRGIIVHRKHLYVADEAGDAVKVFHVDSGEFIAHITGPELKAPVHLILHGETLYIGASGTGSILALDLTSTPPSGKLKARVVIDAKLDAPSGFGVGPDGDLYVAERKKQRVRRFSSDGKKKGTFIDDLPDMPEFLVYVP